MNHSTITRTFVRGIRLSVVAAVFVLLTGRIALKLELPLTWVSPFGESGGGSVRVTRTLFYADCIPLRALRNTLLVV